MLMHYVVQMTEAWFAQRNSANLIVVYTSDGH